MEKLYETTPIAMSRKLFYFGQKQKLELVHVHHHCWWTEERPSTHISWLYQENNKNQIANPEYRLSEKIVAAAFSPEELQ